MNRVRRQLLSIILLVVPILFSGFTPKPKIFTVDTDASSATWMGRTVTGKHSGTVYISGGELQLDNGKMVQGTVHVDVNSLTVNSIGNLQLNAQLTSRLKGKEFFDTYNHPAAHFRISSVQHESGNMHTVSGSLTIKGKTQAVKFPATIHYEKKQLGVWANIVIDRTKFNITSGSSDFFKDLGDAAIHNEFELSIHLVASR